MGHRTLKDLEDMSKVQLNEKIIPAIADIEVTLVMGSRLKTLIKSRRKSAEVSWDPRRKETVEDKDVPRHQRSLESVTGAQEDERVIPCPRAAETDALQTYNYVQIPLNIALNYHARAKQFTASLPRGRALVILEEIDRDDGRATHEVLDPEEDLGSGGMLAAADRTPTSEERLVPHGAQNIRRSQEHVRGTVE